MLWVEKLEVSYDLSQIRPGYLVYARHYTWDEGRAGFVTAATEKKISVQYHPGIGNVTNHFHIPISEAAAGEWDVRWSLDLSEVHECSIEREEGADEPGGSEEREEGADEPGGVAL